MTDKHDCVRTPWTQHALPASPFYMTRGLDISFATAVRALYRALTILNT